MPYLKQASKETHISCEVKIKATNTLILKNIHFGKDEFIFLNRGKKARLANDIP